MITKKRTAGALAGALLIGTALASLSSCGSSAESLDGVILDCSSRTTITAEKGDTVKDILSDAEISLDEGDTVSPALDECISDDGFEITISRMAEVTVTDGEAQSELSLVGSTVEDAINESGITLGDQDTVNYSLDTYLTDGMTIEIEHWYTVELSVSGESSDLVTQAKTVEELLDEQNITLGDEDELTPDSSTAIENGLKIEVKYVSKRQETEEQSIDYETVYEDSEDLYEGETEVKQEGENGTRTITYEITYVDGEEDTRTVVSDEVTKEAVDEIILVGKKQKTTTTTTTTTTSAPATQSTTQAQQTTTAAPTTTTQQQTEETQSGKKVVSKEQIYDCDGSGHGYYIITYDDGSVEYEDF